MLKVILYGPENDSKYRGVAPLKLLFKYRARTICTENRKRGTQESPSLEK